MSTAKNSNQNFKTMDYLSFATAVNRFENKLLGENSISIIGLEYTTGDISINIYAREENNYELEIDQFAQVIGGEWQQLSPTQIQRIVLERFMKMECNRIFQVHDQRESDNADAMIDAERWNDTKVSFNLIGR